MARDSLSEGILIAKRQSRGRGRLGRSFASPEGGLYLSLLTSRLAPGASVLGVTPAAALAVRRAILRVFGLGCSIKYPNDLLLDGKKVCGILCESVSEGDRFCVVIGVGINVFSDVVVAEERPGPVFPPGSLKEVCEKAKDPRSITELETALIEELDAVVDAFASGGALDEEEYRKHCIDCPGSIIQY